MRICRNYINFGFLVLAVMYTSLACSNDTPSSSSSSTATVTDVTVKPSTASVIKGGTQQFRAAVTGTNSPAQTVSWTVTGGGTGTTIANNGILSVAAGETIGTHLTVTATSTVDTAKSGVATVTVADNTLTGTVSIIGTPRAGRTITANTAALGGTGTITYQWKRGDTSAAVDTTISGVTSANYLLVTTDAGKYIQVTVTRAGYTGNIDSTIAGPVQETTITTTPLDSNATGVKTFTSNSNGNQSLTDSPYGYEMWTQGGNNNKLTWYGPNQGGGAAFKAEWTNPNDFLGRIGYFWGNGGQFTQYKNMYADFNYTRSGRNTAGSYSYIGIYGWAKNPSAAKDEEKLIEYYIVEDWFGNQWVEDTKPMTKDTTGGTIVGSYTLDGATYSVIKNVRKNQPSIEGTKTFTQYFSIRQTLRKTGSISITEHFKKWDGMGMKLGNMYECKFLVEAGGGTGWLEFTYLEFSQED